jgi:hypothetical protein
MKRLLKKSCLFVGILLALVLFQTTAMSSELENSNTVSSFVGVSSIFQNKSLCFDLGAYDSSTVRIRRLSDNRIVAPTTAGFPNDRVRRGEEYNVEAVYNTASCNGLVYFESHTGGINGPSDASTKVFADGTMHDYVLTWRRRVPTDPNIDNVYIKIVNRYSGYVGTNIRLPIGSY